MCEKVVVTGIGVYNSAGKNISSFWESIINGTCNVDNLDLPIFDHMRSSKAHSINCDLESYENKLTYFALDAVQEALEDSGLGKKSINKAGVVVSSANGAIDKLEDYSNCKEIDSKSITDIKQYPISNLLQDIVCKYNIEGPSNAVTTACASGNIAISIACDEILFGNTSCMLVGGSEIISYTIMGGFNSIRSISNTNCRPFDTKRDGLVIGEGSGFLVLESLSHAIERNADIYCEISGYAHTCDASNFTNPNGKGLKKALIKALSKAGIGVEDIDYINAHGTGTTANDKAEIYAVRDSFENTNKKVWVSSTKPIHGHMLGCTGITEAIVCALALKHQIIPPNINLETPEDRGIEFPSVCVKSNISNVISFSQAFGGVNSVLVFGKGSYE